MVFIALVVVVLTVGCGANLEPASQAAPVSTRVPVAPPNPEFIACRTGTRMIVDYRFATFPTNRAQRPLALVTSSKSAGNTYGPFTFTTETWKKSGRITKPLGLGKPPWRVLLSVFGPNGGRSPTISRDLLPCR